jgi:hypothetical protein
MVVPSVGQQLAAVRHTIAKTIMPALAADADFEREQAGLVLASLDWAMDVVDSEHRYERVEHEDYRALLAALLEADPDGGIPESRAVLDAAAAPPDDLPGLRVQTRALKLAADATLTSLGGRDEAAAASARVLISDIARRQTERELAWARMTGFPKNAEAVADVLARQAVGSWKEAPTAVTT